MLFVVFRSTYGMVECLQRALNDSRKECLIVLSVNNTVKVTEYLFTKETMKNKVTLQKYFAIDENC